MISSEFNGKSKEDLGETHALDFGSTLFEQFVFSFLRVSTQDLDSTIKIDMFCVP